MSELKIIASAFHKASLALGTRKRRVPMSEKAYEFNEYDIPERMMEGIKKYLEQGIRPDIFLAAIIQNDLWGACAFADDENRRNIPDYVAYFQNECPIDCWGSAEIMEAWIKIKQAEKKESDEISEPKDFTCPDCNDEGRYDIDIGGGEIRRAFCDCEKGQELARQIENSRQTRIDIKVDEYMERRKGR